MERAKGFGRAVAPLALAAVAAVARADAATCNDVRVCAQTSAAGFCRMTENRLDVSWDWSWEWAPADACEATVTFAADFLETPRTVAVTDVSATNLVMDDLFDVGADMPSGVATVTLAFRNAEGASRSKSHLVEVVPGAFGHAEVRHGPTDRNHWQAIRHPVRIPWDTDWFINEASSAHLLWTDLTTGEIWTNSFNRPVGVAVYGADALPKRPLKVELWFRDLRHPVNRLCEAWLDAPHGGTLVVFR